MMRLDELVAIKHLYPTFEQECIRVANRIGHKVDGDFYWADNCTFWSIDSEKVWGSGSDREGDPVSCEFPIDYLAKTDEELDSIISHIKEEQEKERQLVKEMQENKLREKELAELKRLQEKYKDI